MNAKTNREWTRLRKAYGAAGNEESEPRILVKGRVGETAKGRSRREVNLVGRFNAADGHTRSTDPSHRTLTGRAA